MFGEREFNSIAINDLFQIFPKNIKLLELFSFKKIYNLKNILFHRLFALQSICKPLNLVIAMFNSFLFFSSVIVFNYLIGRLKIFQHQKIAMNNGNVSISTTYNLLLLVYSNIIALLFSKCVINFLFFILAIFKNFLFLIAKKSLIFTIFKSSTLFLKNFTLSLFLQFKKFLKLFFNFFNNESSFFKFIISYTLIKRRMIM